MSDFIEKLGEIYKSEKSFELIAGKNEVLVSIEPYYDELESLTQAAEEFRPTGSQVKEIVIKLIK